jgi:sulfur carrier protein
VVVVEINGNIVEKDNFDNTFIKENDKVEVVRFVGGG